jgi:hypothetical protein
MKMWVGVFLFGISIALITVTGSRMGNRSQDHNAPAEAASADASAAK